MPAPAAQPLPFRVRAGRLLRRHGVLGLLVTADVVTKVAAFRLLPHGEPVEVFPGLRLLLAVNEWGVMGGVEGMGAVASKPAYTMLLAAGLVALAWGVLRLAESGLGFGRRMAVGTAAFFGIAFLAEAGEAALPGVDVPAGLLIPSIRVAALMLALALYGASRVPRSRLPFTLLAAGALANAASSLYPPFDVVDFLVVPLAPLASLLGNSPAIGSDSTVGVINLADVYLFAFPFALVAWPVAFALSRAGRGTEGRVRRLAPPPAKG